MKLLLLVVMLSIGLSNQSFASNIERQITITVSHTSKASSIRGKSAIRFKEMLEAKLSQKVKVNIYENSLLYKSNEELEALDLGGVNLIITSTNKVGEIEKIPELQLFNLPFLFTTNNDFNKVINGKSGNMLLNIINKKLTNSEAIGFLAVGFRDLAGKEFYKTPSDFMNKTMITTSDNGPISNWFKSKTVLTVDSFENNLSIINSGTIADISLNNYANNNLQNTFKNITESHHSYNADIILVNKRWFNSLPEDIKNNIMDALKNANEYNLELLNKTEIEIKIELRKSGIKFYQWNNNQLETFKKSVIPIHANFLNKINKELLLETYKEIKNK